MGMAQRISLAKDLDAPRKVIISLHDQPDDHRLDCGGMFEKFGFSEQVEPQRHRWELDRWVSQHSSDQSQKMIGGSERFLRLGPYGSVRVADAVAGRLMKEFELSARVESNRPTLPA